MQKYILSLRIRVSACRTVVYSVCIFVLHVVVVVVIIILIIIRESERQYGSLCDQHALLHISVQEIEQRSRLFESVRDSSADIIFNTQAHCFEGNHLSTRSIFTAPDKIRIGNPQRYPYLLISVEIPSNCFQYTFSLWTHVFHRAIGQKEKHSK